MPEPPTRPPTPDERAAVAAAVEEAMAAAAAIGDFLERETVLLRGMRVSEAGALHVEKARLAERVRRASVVLRRFPREVVLAAGGDRLLPLLRRLDAATHENERATGAAKQASERVVRVIKRIVTQHGARADGYGRTGRGAGAPETVPSIVINTKL